MSPITLSILTPSDYGLLALANSFISVITVFVGMGLRQSFQLDYFHCTPQERKKLINDNIIIYLLVSTPLFVLLSCFYRKINTVIFIDSASYKLIFMSLLVSFIYFFVEFFYQVLKYQCNAKKIALLQVSIALLTVGLNVFFLLYLQCGVASILCAQAVGMLVVTFIALKTYIKKNCFAFFDMQRSTQNITNYIARGLPFIPSVLFAWILSCGDRWILAHYSNLHNVGIYSLANSFSQLFQLLILYPMTASYIPHVLNTFAQKKDQIHTLEQINKKTMIVCMTLVTITITVGFICTKSFLYTLLPTRYHEAINYIWLLLMGYVFLLGTYFSTILIQFKQKRLFTAFAFITPAILNILLNILLIPHFAIYGCVIATFSSYAAYFALTLWYNKRLTPANNL
ncbi:oligosaccharide flippase family protein [Candidatus Dependentiae bacterium]|nr:oligosaccharide flippase family protein [Candidatus Dependentiae bacterium]